MSIYKICSKCKKTLSIREFTKDCKKKDGLCYHCKSCRVLYHKIYRKQNQIILSKNHQKYRFLHKTELAIKSKSYRELTKKEISIRNKKYYQTHKKELNKHKIQRRKTDINFKIICNLRIRLNNALKRNSKKTTTKELLGCSISFLKIHLEKQFLPGMNWKNHSKKGWHIDHIKPCALFDLSKASEQKKCFHYTNLQPLWAIDNLIKGSNYSSN